MWASSLLFGSLVGFSLGMTGGGGSTLAVPLLVYGLGVRPREAVGVSLAAVGATALVGALARWRAGEVDFRRGLMFAAGGVAGAPLGSWLAGQISEAVLLLAFAALMLVVAIRMWVSASRPAGGTPEGSATSGGDDGGVRFAAGPVAKLAAAGLTTGVLAGLFGVGGGFIIVPALVLFGGMSMHRAIATSLLVIALVSVSGVASHLYAGRSIALETAALFVAGGVVGMFVGSTLGRQMPGALLQRVFAIAIVAVAVFVIGRTLA